MLISEKILNVRKSMHFDEKHFGNFFRLNEKTISNWEKGYVIPRRNELRLISRYTRIAIDTFLDKTKAIVIESDKLIVKDDPNGLNEINEFDKNTVSEDYPQEDNSRYERD